MNRSKKRKLWTQHEEEMLFSLYKQNLSYEEIQENDFPNRTKGALITKINRLIKKENLDKRSRFQYAKQYAVRFLQSYDFCNQINF